MTKIGVLLCAVAILCGPKPASSQILNGDFEADGGPFNIPTGWVPFGSAKFEGRHEGDWRVQVADAHAGRQVGLYQVVPNVRPGVRYRLMAEAFCGNPQLPVRIGLVVGNTIEDKDITWSEEYRTVGRRNLSVEAVAEESHLLVILEMRNLNPTYQLLDAGGWDNVRLIEVAGASPPSRASADDPGASIPSHTPADDAGARIPSRTHSERESLPAKKAPNDATPPGAPGPGDVAAAALSTPRWDGDRFPPPPSDPLGQLANLWSLAWPKSGVRAWQASTHHPDPENNSDFDRVEGQTTIDGQPWTVLRTLAGPGAITRIWMTNFHRDGRIRIEADGRPVVECGLFEFFGGHARFYWPLANKTSGAWMSHVPIPFERSARVLVKKAEQPRFYWHVNWQTFSGEDVPEPDARSRAGQIEHLQTIRAQWAAASFDPKPHWPGTEEVARTLDLPAGGTAELWSTEHPGMIAAIHIDLPSDAEAVWQGVRLRAVWDGAAEPQVDAPLGLFFGTGGGRTIVRGLLMGMAPPEGGYAYFPMPFKRARLELANTTSAPIEPVTFKVRWVPLDAAGLSPMRFHARHKADARAGEGGLYFPLETEGAGHLVGLTASMACASKQDTHYLEGDEYIWVDGEPEPSIAGTGTEDYFSCGWYFMDGPITLAPVGAPLIDRKSCRVSAYRLHVPDWIPFTRSIRFGLEVGGSRSSPEYGRYSTVCYYYLQAGSQ